MRCILPGKSTVPCLAAAFALLFAATYAPAQSSPDKFLFLTFHLKAGNVSLVESRVIAGALKPQRDSTRPEALRVALEKTADAPLESRRLDDPSVKRLEYEDPEHPGKILSKTVQLEETEFIVRLPYHKEARQVAIYRETLQPPAAPGKAGTAVTHLLARIPLPQEEAQ